MNFCGLKKLKNDVVNLLYPTFFFKGLVRLA
jgi:hypothetical protein